MGYREMRLVARISVDERGTFVPHDTTRMNRVDWWLEHGGLVEPVGAGTESGGSVDELRAEIERLRALLAEERAEHPAQRRSFGYGVVEWPPASGLPRLVGGMVCLDREEAAMEAAALAEHVSGRCEVVQIIRTDEGGEDRG